MFSILFWKDAGERAVKTFAQNLAATLTTAGFGMAVAGWKAALIAAGVAAVYSVLTSVLSANVPGGTGVTASLVRSVRGGKHEAANPPAQEV